MAEATYVLHYEDGHYDIICAATSNSALVEPLREHYQEYVDQRGDDLPHFRIKVEVKEFRLGDADVAGLLAGHKRYVVHPDSAKEWSLACGIATGNHRNGMSILWAEDEKDARQKYEFLR